MDMTIPNIGTTILPPTLATAPTSPQNPQFLYQRLSTYNKLMNYNSNSIKILKSQLQKPSYPTNSPQLNKKIAIKMRQRQMQQRQTLLIQQIQHITKIKKQNEKIYKNKIYDLEMKIRNKVQPSQFELSSVLVQLRVCNGDLEGRLAHSQLLLKQKQGKIESLIAQLEKVNHMLKYPQRQIKQTKQKLIKQNMLLKSQLVISEQKKMEYERANITLQNTIQMLTQQKQQLNINLSNTNQQLSSQNAWLNQKIDRLQQQLESCYQSIKRLENRLYQLQQKIEDQLSNQPQPPNNQQNNSLQLDQKSQQIQQEVLSLRQKVNQLNRINQAINLDKDKIIDHQHMILGGKIGLLEKQLKLCQEQIKENQDTIFILERSNSALRKQLMAVNQYLTEQDQQKEREKNRDFSLKGSRHKHINQQLDQLSPKSLNNRNHSRFRYFPRYNSNNIAVQDKIEIS